MKQMLMVGLLFAIMSGCTFLKVSIVEEIQPLVEQALSGEGRDKILIIDLSGVITGSEGDKLWGDKKKPGLLARVREELDRARRDKTVKAVVLRINSPGGGVTPSDTLFHELMTLKKDAGVPLVAHIMDVGASGAYYAALAADRITAQPTSIVGSIGVIAFRVDATGLMQKIGIETAEITTGSQKGMGSPFRPMTPEERSIFQGMIDSLHERFISLIVESRALPVDKIRQLADGRVYTSQEALAAGLIDGIGYLDDAIELAKKQAKISQALVITYVRPGDYKSNLYSQSLINLELGDAFTPGARFLYLWWP